MLSIWNIIDPIYYTCSRLTRINAASDGNIFRVRLMKYRGENITLADGTCIRKGDTLLKIHLHNVILVKSLSSMLNEVKKGKHIYRLVEASMPDLAAYVKNHHRCDEIKAIIGITMLNKGCRLLGFETYSIKSAPYRALKWVTQLPLYFISVSDPLKTVRKQSIKYLLMSKETLLERYCRV
jgi:hypothetical protein